MLRRSLCWAVAAAIGAGLAGLPARAENRRAPGETPLADVLQIVVLGRRVVAIDGLAGTETSESLELGENVLWSEARGRIGVALTDRRVLAVATRSAAWQAMRYLRGERPPPSALLGERVALVLTGRRAVGFDGGSGNLVETSLGPRERVLAADTSGAVAVVVTERRALGLSPFTGGFFEAKLNLEEAIEEVSATGNVATVRTPRRILTFQAATGRWVELSRSLRD